MWLLPWHVTLSADRKAVLTAVGISLGAAFAFIGLAVPQALDVLSDQQDAFLSQTHVVITREDGSAFEVPSAWSGADTLLLFAQRARLDRGADVLIVAVAGDPALEIPEGAARPVFSSPVAGDQIDITGPPAMRLSLLDPIDDRAYPAGSLLVSSATMASIDPSYSVGRATMIVLPASRVDALSAAQREGFSIERVPALSSFFARSGQEVARDLVFVVAFSGILIGLFSYEFLRSEVRERRREIGLWRGIGLRSRDVMVLLLARALAISVAGTAVGLVLALTALGIAGRLLHLAVLRPELAPGPALVVLVVLGAAGGIGAIVPAYVASRETVRESLEAAA